MPNIQMHTPLNGGPHFWEHPASRVQDATLCDNPQSLQRLHSTGVCLTPRYTLFLPPSLPIQVDLGSNPSSHPGSPP
jgi:hypothetical protein